MFYQKIIRPILFLISPETIHRWIIQSLCRIGNVAILVKILRWYLTPKDSAIAIRAFGRDLPSPIGLAAGLDKDAEVFEVLGAIGFGFVEVGTVTAQSQPGNPKPRLFRLPVDRALVNRMGFNNRGAAEVAVRLGNITNRHTVLGINIGKTKIIPESQATEDYLLSANRLSTFADFMVVNVSSPNTPGLRNLQTVELLRPLLSNIKQVTDKDKVPLLVKIAPDLSDKQIDDIADLALELKIAGIIATNTTTARDRLLSTPKMVAACGEGGLSGKPLKHRSLEVLRRLRDRVGSRLLLISVGGIETVDDVWERIAAGATLVQIYTAFVYQGPLFPYRLSKALAKRVKSLGYKNISEIVGIERNS